MRHILTALPLLLLLHALLACASDQGDVQTQDLRLSQATVGDTLWVDFDEDGTPEGIVLHGTNQQWGGRSGLIDSLRVLHFHGSQQMPTVIHSESFLIRTMPARLLDSILVGDLDRNGHKDILLKYTNYLSATGEDIEPIKVIEVTAVNGAHTWTTSTTFETVDTGWVTDIDRDGFPELVASNRWYFDLMLDEMGMPEWAAVYSAIPGAGGYRLANGDFKAAFEARLNTDIDRYQRTATQWQSAKTPPAADSVYVAALQVLETLCLFLDEDLLLDWLDQQLPLLGTLNDAGPILDWAPGFNPVETLGWQRTRALEQIRKVRDGWLLRAGPPYP